MLKIKEILRLRFDLQRSYEQIAKSCGVGRSTVGECLRRAEAAGLSWPLSAEISDAELYCRLYPKKTSHNRKLIHPNWSEIHLELKKKGVTRTLLWQEYIEQNPAGMGYSQFCDLYRSWCGTRRLSMHQSHKAGEKLFVDYCGSRVEVFDSQTGQSRKAEIFVATWGASNFTYAEATWSQSLPCWIGSHVNAFEYFGCVPQIVVPDNLRSAVTKACRYDPEINESYAELARHYNCAVIPAHVRKPKHKAKVEYSVLLVTRWILAKLRKRKFFSLDELNEAIWQLLEKLNDREFQKIPGSRRSQFNQLDQPAANPLPSTRYVFAEVKWARVNVDYHIAVDDHFYSLPYQLRGKKVKVRLTKNSLEIFYQNKRVWTHQRSHQKYGYTTISEHRPKAHRDYADWTPERIKQWASQSGDHVAEIVEKIMSEKQHPEQGFRASMGVIRLAKRYGNQRLNLACQRALNFRNHRFRYIKNILEKGLEGAKELQQVQPPIIHENLRGGQYYQNYLEDQDVDQ